MAAVNSIDETEEIVQDPSPGNSGVSSGSPRIDSDSHSDTVSSNGPSISNRLSVPRDLAGSKLILPSNISDSSRVTNSKNRIKTLPGAPCFKDKKDRGPASCLFRGHDHSQRLIEEFDSLRNLQCGGGLVDLDIICLDEIKIKVHKVVMAAASSFFREQLCRANVLVPVVLRLEDFGFHLTYEAVALVIEFIYRGEVVIASNQLIIVANAAHSLGIDGLREFLPNVSPATTQHKCQDNIQRHGEHSKENENENSKDKNSNARMVGSTNVPNDPSKMSKKEVSSKHIGSDTNKNNTIKPSEISDDEVVVLSDADNENVNFPRRKDSKVGVHDYQMPNSSHILSEDKNINSVPSSNLQGSKVSDTSTNQKFLNRAGFSSKSLHANTSSTSLNNISNEVSSLNFFNQERASLTNHLVEAMPPQVAQPPHSTNEDIHSENIETDNLPSTTSTVDNITSHSSPEEANVHLDREEGTIKPINHIYQSRVYPKPLQKTAAQNKTDDLELLSATVRQTNEQDHNIITAIQHCSVGSTIPLSKSMVNSLQVVSSRPSVPSSNNLYLCENATSAINVTPCETATNFNQEMVSEYRNCGNQDRNNIDSSRDLLKSITIAPASLSNLMSIQSSSGINRAPHNDALISSIGGQNCYATVIATTHQSSSLQSSTQNCTSSIGASTHLPSSSVINVVKSNDGPCDSENQMTVSSASTRGKIGPPVSTSSHFTSSTRSGSTGGKLKGKLRVINQVGTIVGNTTPNIQTSSAPSSVNFHGLGDDERNSNVSLTQTHQFVDTLLSGQTEGNLNVRTNSQIDGMNLGSSSGSSSDLFHSDSQNTLGHQHDYISTNPSDINVGSEEVTIIEEIAIGGQTENIPFHMVNGAGYQYQQSIHPDLNSFQISSFSNEAATGYLPHPSQSQSLHNQVQHYRIQDHPPPPPLWMPSCPPPPLAAAPQQAFSAVAAHAVAQAAVAQAAVAQQQSNYDELQAMNNTVICANNEEPITGRSASTEDGVDNIITWSSSQHPLIVQTIDEPHSVRKAGVGLQKVTKSKKEEFEDVHDYIEVEEEERHPVNTLSGVVVRTEPPDLDDVSWSIPHSPSMATDIHYSHQTTQIGDRESNVETNPPTSNWTWTTPAEESIVDWSTRLASMVGNTQGNQMNAESSTNVMNAQTPQNWHTLAAAAASISSGSLTTPTSTISESPPLLVLPEQPSTTNYPTSFPPSAMTALNQNTSIHIRHPSSDIVSFIATSKGNSSSSSVISSPLRTEKDQKTSGLPLLAEAAQVAAAAVTVKSERYLNKSHKRRKTIIGERDEFFDDLDGTRKRNISGKHVGKGELEVRKDLTVPSGHLQKKYGNEANVFQVDFPSTTTAAATSTIRQTIKSDILNRSLNSEQSIIAIGPNSRQRQHRKMCIECSMTFASTGRLKQHVKYAHRKEEVFSCPTCNEQGLRGKENLKLHMYKSHGVGEIFRCEYCNFETSARATFTKHTSTAHPIDPDEQHDETTETAGFGNSSEQHIVLTDDGALKNNNITAISITSQSRGKLGAIGLLRFKCNFCTRAFKSKAGLKLHLQQHTNEAMHNCMVCPFKTPQQQNLIKHLATKHKRNLQGEDLKSNKECKLCNFKCVAEYQLKTHILRKHTARSDMKYQCNECGYASVEKSALDKHIRFRHTKERPFMCGTCGFSTHTKSAMLRHNLSHTGQKPHLCDECGSAYADKKRLRDHQASQHADSSGYGFSIPTFGCDFCGFSSRRKDNLRAHIRRVHPELSGEQSSNGTVGTDEPLSTTSISSRTISSLQRSSEEVIVPEALPNTAKTEETKPDIRLMNNTLLAPKQLENSFSCSGNGKGHINSTTSYNQEVSSLSKLPSNDRSHIVGHINQDGSIRPVASATPSHPSGLYEDPLGLNCESKGTAFQQSPTDVLRTNVSVTTSDSKGQLLSLNMDLVQSCNAAEIVSSVESSENC